MDHERVIAGVVAWSEADENIALVALLGSFGRGDTDVIDAPSDLDLQLYVNQPAKLLADPA